MTSPVHHLQQFFFASLLLTTLALPTMAQNHEHHDRAPAGSAAAQSDTMTAGELKRVDIHTGKLTIRHEEIRNLGMPSMTMVFHLADPSLGNGLKPGDKLRFHVEEINGALTITRLERLR